MPQFTVELSDGTSIDLEADKQPTEQEVINALKPLPTSAGGAFARAVATGIGPAAAGAAAFTPSMEIGAAVFPEAAPVAGLATGLIGAGVAAGAAAWGQKKLLQTALPEVATTLERLQSSDVEQHPYATIAGGLAAQLPSMEVALPRTLAEIPKRAAIQAGITGGQTIIGEGRLPTGAELGEAAIAGTVFGQPRKYLLPKGLAALRGAQYARSQQEAAKVHGDLRAQPQQGAGQVPAAQGGPGVQPQAQAVAQDPQVLLSKVEARIGELSVDPGVTGRTVVGLNPDGSPKFEENIRDDFKLRQLKSLEVTRDNLTKQIEAQRKASLPAEVRAVRNDDGTYTVTKKTAQGETSVTVATIEDSKVAADELRQNKPVSVKQVKAAETPQREMEMEASPEEIAAHKAATTPLPTGRIMNPESGLLKAEELPIFQSAIDANAQRGMSGNLRVIPGDPKSPGETAYPDFKTGEIVLNREAFDADTIGMTPEEKADYIHALMAHEGIHLATPASVAESFWNALSGLEKKLYTRAYAGRRPLDQATANNPQLMGWEALRMRWERLQGMDRTEIIGAVKSEQWTQRGIDLMTKALENIYRLFRTTGSKVQDRILKDMTDKLNAAREASGMVVWKPEEALYTEGPFARRREEEPVRFRATSGVRTGHEIIVTRDATTGKWRLTLFSPSDEETRFGKPGQMVPETHEIFDSRDQAIRGAKNMMWNLGVEHYKGVAWDDKPFARRRAGEVSHTELDKMDDAQAAAYFNQIRQQGIPPQFDAVQAGIKLDPADVPELERLRDESGKKMMDAIKANDSTAQLAQMGKNVWYSGAIEGARKSGPNYHIAQLKRMRDLPPVPEGYVRLYHGEGGPAGAGMGSLWYSTDPNRAATFGPELRYVDVPKGISDAAWSALQKRGHGTATDRILPEEWVVRSEQVPGTEEPPTFDLTPAARRRNEEVAGQWDLPGLFPKATQKELEDIKGALAPTSRLLLRDADRLKIKPGSDGKYDGAQIANRLLNLVPTAEKQILETLGILRHFKAGTRFSAEELDKWLRVRMPRVEVKKFDEPGMSDEFASRENVFEEMGRVEHDLENDGYRILWATDGELRQFSTPDGRQMAIEQVRDAGLPFNIVDKIEKLRNLSDDLASLEGGAEGYKWYGIAPKDRMMGYHEAAVTVSDGVNRLYGNAHDFPYNTIGFYRGYLEPRPDGGKTLHVIEVQTDMAVQIAQDQFQVVGRPELGIFATRKEALKKAMTVHPLAKHWERMVLKAAIEHAKIVGADRVATQDAESAMMQEHHDRRANKVEDIPQLAGMKLHYDNIIPSIMRELTKDEGQKVSFGQHKESKPDIGDEVKVVDVKGLTPSGFQTRRLELVSEWPPPRYAVVRVGDYLVVYDNGVPGAIRPNLLFKNPDGTPKTDVTATEFRLQKVGEPPYSIAGRGPYARRRGKKEPYDPEQEKLFPKNLTAMGVPGEVPTAEGRPSLQHPELTGKAIDDSIWENLSSNKPGIEGMMGQMREKFWRDISPTQVYETFRDKMWDYLLSVPGAELERIRRSLKLESVFGSKPIADTTTARSEQQREFNLSEASRKAKAAALRGEADQIERLAASAPEKALETPGGELRGQPMALPGMGLPAPKPARRRPTAPTKGELLAQAKARRSEADIIERGSELTTPVPENVGEQEKRRRQAEKYRRTNIGVIARKLLKVPDDQAQAVKVKLNREKLTFKDLGWWRDLPYRVFQEISEKEASMPDVLGAIITRDARLGPTDPVSNSKRVVAFRNRETGEVHVVSAWMDGRRGALVTDPRMTGFRGVRPSTELTPELLNKWRAIYTMLTDEPLKDFHQVFKGMDEFNADIGKEATAYAMSETARAPFYKAAVGLAEEEGALVKGAPLTDAEAGKVISHIIIGGGFPKGPEDVELSLANLARKRDWPAITGYQKIYDAFKARHPEMSPLEALANLPKHIYDTWNIGKDEDAFKQAIMGYVNAEGPETVQPKPGTAAATAAGVTPTAREFAPFTPGQVPVSARERMMRKMRPPVPPTEKLPPQPKLPAETLPQEALEQIQAATGEKPAELAAEVTPVAERKPSGKQAQLYTTGPKGERIITPMSRRRAIERTEEEFAKAKSLLGSIISRKKAKEDVYRLRDGMSNDADVESRLGGNNVRAISQVRKDPKRAEMVRRATKAVIATGELQAVTRSGRIKMIWAPDRAKLPKLIGKVDVAIRDATTLMQKRNPIDRTIGRLWLRAAKQLRSELEFAQTNWHSSDLRDTVTATRVELLKQFMWEKKHGSRLSNKFNYFPGRYEAELFNDNTVFFGGMRVLGRNFRRPKVFPNYYEAIAAGPYIPKNYDAANLVEHRLRQGRQEMNKAMWMEMLKGIKDPDSNRPIVTDPITTEIIDTPAGKIVQNIQPKSPDFEHELISLGPGKKTYAVLVGYKDTLEKAIGQSGIQQSATGRAALAMTRSLKHGALLIYDTFHPGRLLQYATAIMGGKELPGVRAGLTALDFREADLPKAVAAGIVSQRSADWATGQVEINIGGVKMMRSRQEILRQAVREGFNVARHQDALFGDIKHVLPGVTEFNRLIFDKLTRGLMATAMVKKFEEYQAKHPNIDSRVLLKDIAKDLNIFYGSMGRQGFIKNPTFRDIGQLMFLAPNWVEGLIQKEARFYGRATGISQALGRTGVPRMGVLGKGMANGLMFYFGMAQVINLLTRGQFTWQNKEEGLDKKLSAWVPTAPNSPEGDGFWLSPLSVFAEVTHDLMRLGETKRNAWEAIRQIGYNKLGPWGRLGMVLATRETARGERLPTTGTIAKEAALQLAPIPITLSSGIRYAAHEVAPETFPQLPKGRVMQQLIASGAGIKVTPGETAAKQIGRMATNFMQKENLREQTVDIVPTVNPSYSKLWQAVRMDDNLGARAILKDLEKYHTDGQILEAAANAARRPFTGSHSAEGLFMESLSDEELKLYDAANLERMEDYQKFLDWYARQP